MIEPSCIEIVRLREEDVDDLIGLARQIWFQHYPKIITVEQIEYMLGQRYTHEVILAQLRSGKSWWDKLIVDGDFVGFGNYELKAPRTMKLDKLYVRADMRGRGFGRLLIRRVEDEARRHACDRIELQVNKHNRDSIEMYRRCGFSIARAAVFDIGGGFVMDDFVMSKPVDAEHDDR